MVSCVQDIRWFWLVLEDGLERCKSVTEENQNTSACELPLCPLNSPLSGVSLGNFVKK